MILKPVSLEYAEEINKGLDTEITRYMFPQPCPLKETVEWIKSKLEEIEKGNDFTVVVLDKETGEFLGGGGIHHIDTKAPEFGIWLKKDAHGYGYGRETVTGLKKWADENLEYDYLLYPVATENIPSRKIPESLGGKIEREYTDTNALGMEFIIVEYRIYKNSAGKKI